MDVLPPPPPRPPGWGDPIAETLELAGARCVLTRGFTYAGAWALSFPPPGRLKVHAVLEGVTWLVMDGIDEPQILRAGDVVILAGDRRYVLASDPDLAPVEALPLLKATVEPYHHTGPPGVRDVTALSGHVELEVAGKDLLLGALPPLIHMRAGSVEAPAVCWLLHQAFHEMREDRPGASFVADHLAQLLFVQVLRTYLAEADTFPAGWLRALADEQIAPALRLMHGDPARQWTLVELARATSMSRTTFADRFKTVAGAPPLTYLYNWRMRLARRSLWREDTPVSELASALGYASESAFSNAFKRTTGMAPRHYRCFVRTDNARLTPVPVVTGQAFPTGARPPGP
ncbi:AraC family transcriptional regulator [Streptomyces sp. NPDC051555]|uniref:AraC family transcriptional regulator n=1 Tax=Streptomyces sp. NPDC051555 TaxID=3365657 RepID=UPI0037B03463